MLDAVSEAFSRDRDAAAKDRSQLCHAKIVEVRSESAKSVLTVRKETEILSGSSFAVKTTVLRAREDESAGDDGSDWISRAEVEARKLNNAAVIAAASEEYRYNGSQRSHPRTTRN